MGRQTIENIGIKFFRRLDQTAIHVQSPGLVGRRRIIFVELALNFAQER